STQKSPTIPTATNILTGKYTVVVTTDGGCTNLEELLVTVVPKPLAIIDQIPPICKGAGIQLQASGGVTYRWVPSTGLSQADTANPIATPSVTTTYTVYSSNGACEVPGQITVVVLDDPLANAGPDKKMMKGDFVQLDGAVSGDEVTYRWSPETYLDNPTILNPIATPPSDITYTLTVKSNYGCTLSSSEVFVRVYQEVEVPGAFSPNGDGINDLWEITAADMFPTAIVKVVNRYGEVVFESRNYDEKPWDGKHKNKDVPAGVYYYVINLNNELKPRSGSLTVIR
ncbi:MAG: gliding motility-associated C-terminal domain-containing protein, partial [Pedobacter sp.]